MGRRKRSLKAAGKTTIPGKGKKFLRVGLPVLLVAVAACLAFFCNTNPTPTPGLSTNTPVPQKVTRRAQSLNELLSMSPERLAKVDVAEMNLLCATGLPGAETLDIDKCMATLDRWAEKVKFETERHVYRAHDPRYAEHYKHSKAWLRAEFLAQVLQQDLGVHYNMERVRNIDFTNAKDLFIHGMVDDPNGGTCASMPVLYVAVGRRLRYPLKLVLTNAHVFVRWDDGKTRFNIDVSTNGGVNEHADEYYRTWPMPWTEAEAKSNRYLVSLTPAEELASFLASRGHCLLDTGRTKAAFSAYVAAHRLAPDDPQYRVWVAQAQARLMPRTVATGGPHGFREPPMVYRMESVEAINAHNRRIMQQRMRPPSPPNPRRTLPSPYQPGPPQPGFPQPHRPPVP